MTADSLKDYGVRHDYLVHVAERLQELIRECLTGIPRIDSIGARAKSVASFARKAQKRNDDGSPKYTFPLIQIQDQIGARIVVFYRRDVQYVSTFVEKYFRSVECRTIVPDSEWEFGYFGKHWILALPRDVVPGNFDPDLLPQFFELQVKTLFQHAWSEASHDLAYKPVVELSSGHRRRFAFSAAQAWSADREFDALFDELGELP